MKKIFVERENSHTWRIVARECTPRGVDPNRFDILERDIADLNAARVAAEVAKSQVLLCLR